MNAIEGRPEGRRGIWLISAGTAWDLINEVEGDQIHCFLGSNLYQIGADWSKEQALELVERPDTRLALVFPPNSTIGHQLVVLDKDNRWSFDIGEIPESRMVSVEQIA